MVLRALLAVLVTSALMVPAASAQDASSSAGPTLTLEPSSHLVGGAEAGSDFQSASGTLTIPAGATEASVPIQVFDDGAGEENEAVLVGFSDPNIGSLGGFGFGGLVIIDNDRGSST